MTEQFFEMLWDCEQCATRGLLAKSQRHCPACGSAQNPEKRYFPEPGKEIEVAGHRYTGADWLCAYCQSPNGASASFCGNCGGPKDGTKEVARVVDKADEPPILAPTSVTPPSGRRGWGRMVAAIAALVAIVVGYSLFSKHDETATVVSRSWVRTIDVERFAAVSESAWCDALPAGAYDVTRFSQQRGTRQVEAGQECKDKRIDKGDGTFVRENECTPRFKDVPVFDMKCNFHVDRWQVQRTEKAAGDAAATPTWPMPQLATTGFLRGLGQERAGPRHETYTVNLAAKEGKQWRCDVLPAVWAALKEQQNVRLEVRGTGGAVCDSLGR